MASYGLIPGPWNPYKDGRNSLPSLTSIQCPGPTGQEDRPNTYKLFSELHMCTPILTRKVNKAHKKVFNKGQETASVDKAFAAQDRENQRSDSRTHIKA